MPLLPGKNNIGANIETEMGVGKPREQAIAIALNVARKSGVHVAPLKGHIKHMRRRPS